MLTSKLHRIRGSLNHQSIRYSCKSCIKKIIHQGSTYLRMSNVQHTFEHVCQHVHRSNVVSRLVPSGGYRPAYSDCLILQLRNVVQQHLQKRFPASQASALYPRTSTLAHPLPHYNHRTYCQGSKANLCVTRPARSFTLKNTRSVIILRIHIYSPGLHPHPAIVYVSATHLQPGRHRVLPEILSCGLQ